MADFAPGLVGAKASNLAKIASALPSWLSVPDSVALPFGTMEHALANSCNRGVLDFLHSRLAQVESARVARTAAAVSSTLAEIRQLIVSELHIDGELELALQKVLRLLARPDDDLTLLWNAVKRVWASKWTSRAFVSRARTGLSDAELSMGVLVQRMIPADYAFVLHTTNPLALDASSLLGEVVVGLGEMLAGSAPGRPFCFALPKTGHPSAAILSYPSKRTGLFADRASPGLIVRSDSSGEDLDDFAGAGLYDSVAFGPIREEHVDYSTCSLLVDADFREWLLASLRQVATDVEAALGGAPQDIEGVVSDRQITLVQARPQVGVLVRPAPKHLSHDDDSSRPQQQPGS